MKKLLLGVILAGVVGLSGNLFAAKDLDTVRKWCETYKAERSVKLLRDQVNTIFKNDQLLYSAETSDGLEIVLAGLKCRQRPEKNADGIRNLTDFLEAIIGREQLVDSDAVTTDDLLKRIREWCDREGSNFDVTDLQGLLEQIMEDDVDCEPAHGQIEAFDVKNVDQDSISALCKVLSALCEAREKEIAMGELGDYDLTQYNRDSDSDDDD